VGEWKGGEKKNTNHDLWYQVARVRAKRRNFCSSNELCSSSGIFTFPWRRDFKIRGKIIRTLKYPDDFVILSKEETVLGGMIGRLKLEESVAVEMNVEKLMNLRTIAPISVYN
jgi:hypothetical protein